MIALKQPFHWKSSTITKYLVAPTIWLLWFPHFSISTCPCHPAVTSNCFYISLCRSAEASFKICLVFSHVKTLPEAFHTIPSFSRVFAIRQHIQCLHARTQCCHVVLVVIFVSSQFLLASVHFQRFSGCYLYRLMVNFYIQFGFASTCVVEFQLNNFALLFMQAT